MKKVLTVMLLLAGLLWPQSGQPAQELDLYEHELRRELSRSQPGLNAVRELPDYFSSRAIPLSKAEREALNLAQQWAKSPNKPIRLSNGKIAFLHGASIPTIIGAPFAIVDLEFEAGENVQSVLLGDTARWHVDSGAVGIVPHVFVKPLDAGLETSAIVTTSRRVYHLRLISQRDGYMPYVGFIYPEASMAKLREEQEREEKREHFGSAVLPGSTETVSLANLNFNYRVDGSADWKPVQVFSDTDKTYLKLPERVQELPVLLAKSQDEVLINYRIENNVYIVDGLYPELTLLLGVGSRQEKVTIRKR